MVSIALNPIEKSQSAHGILLEGKYLPAEAGTLYRRAEAGKVSLTPTNDSRADPSYAWRACQQIAGHSRVVAQHAACGRPSQFGSPKCARVRGGAFRSPRSNLFRA
jgi:hypothetical protein